MLYEFKDLAVTKRLPRRKKELNYYLAGFTDGEGCFSIALKKQADTRFGWVLDPVFHITQNKDKKFILEIFKRTLTCGRIIPKPGQEETLQFIVDNRRQLAEKIIPFFEKYKLLVKYNDFELFKEIVQALERKEHSNINKFIELVKKAYKMNQNGKQRRYDLNSILKELRSFRN